MPPVRLTWYEGGLMPPRPLELEDYRRMGDNEGCLFVGERGKIVCCCYGQSPRIIPESKMQAVGRPRHACPARLATTRSGSTHARAARSRVPISSTRPSLPKLCSWATWRSVPGGIKLRMDTQ